MSKFVMFSNGLIIRYKEEHFSYVNTQSEISEGMINIPSNIRKDSTRTEPIFQPVNNFRFSWDDVIAEWEAV